MHNQNTLVETRGIESYDGPIFEVFCVDCGVSIGTMTGHTVQAAIHSTAHRGGVKCPPCRALSCYTCGVPLWLGNRTDTYMARGGGVIRECKVCGLDRLSSSPYLQIEGSEIHGGHE